MKLNSLKRSKRSTSLIAFTLGLFTAMSGFVGLSAPTQADAGHQMVVSPSDRLRDGQIVQVTWSGFSPNQPIYLRQCKSTATTEGECSRIQSESSDASGNGISLLRLQSTEGTGHGIAGAPGLRCGVGFDCSVILSTDTDYLHPEQGLSTQLGFVPEASTCPQSGMNVVAGGGTGGVLTVLPDWQTAVCQDPDRVTLDYVRTKGDNLGRTDFQCGISDFAITEVAAGATEGCPATGKVRSNIYAPVANSALVFAYVMRDSVTGQRITDLKLTPDMLSWVFTGQTLTWTGTDSSNIRSQQIANLNSSHSLPANVFVVGRADASALNTLLTRFLLERAADSMASAPSPFDLTEPTEFFPALPGYNDLKSNADAVATAITNFDDYTGQSGMIAVMDAGTAAYYSLPTVAIENAQGTGFIKPTTDAITRGQAAMRVDSNGTAVADTSPNDALAYPLPFTAYAQIPTSDATEASAKALKAWLTHVASDGAQAAVLPGYVPLTSAQRSVVATVADSLKAGEPSPTPTDDGSGDGTGDGTTDPTDGATDSSGSGPGDVLDFVTDGGGFDNSSLGGGSIDGGIVDSGLPFVDSGSSSGSSNSASIFAMGFKDRSALPGVTFPILVLVGLGLSIAGAWNLLWVTRS